MAGSTYRRKQILLRQEDGAPAGFVRIETLAGRSQVEVQGDEIAGDLRAFLLRPGEDSPCALGIITKRRRMITLRAEDVEGCTQAALLSGDRLLFAGGEGADFADIRRRVAKPVIVAQKKPPTLAQPPAEREAKRETPSPAESMTKKTAEPQEGWQLTWHRAAGAPERVTGLYVEQGRATATLDGIEGSYAPEPPPGLFGFHWDNGFWIKITAR